MDPADANWMDGTDTYLISYTSYNRDAMVVATINTYVAGTFTATAPIADTNTAYTYDGLQRLTGAVESPSSSFTYSYDLAGNRTGVTVDGAAVLTNTYDAAGNLTNDGTTSYGYDATNDHNLLQSYRPYWRRQMGSRWDGNIIHSSERTGKVTICKLPQAGPVGWDQRNTGRRGGVGHVGG